MTNPVLVSQAAEAVLRRLPSQNGPGGYGDDFLLGWKAAIELVGQELPEAMAAAQPLLQYALAPDIQALLEWRAAFDAIPVPHAPPAHKHPIDWAAAYPRMWTVLDDACEAMEMEGMHAEPSYKRLKELHRLMGPVQGQGRAGHGQAGGRKPADPVAHRGRPLLGRGPGDQRPRGDGLLGSASQPPDRASLAGSGVPTGGPRRGARACRAVELFGRVLTVGVVPEGWYPGRHDCF